MPLMPSADVLLRGLLNQIKPVGWTVLMIAVAAAVGLTGCMQQLVMKNPRDGNVLVCRDEPFGFLFVRQSEQCARDLERDGWQRITK